VNHTFVAAFLELIPMKPMPMSLRVIAAAVLATGALTRAASGTFAFAQKADVPEIAQPRSDRYLPSSTDYSGANATDIHRADQTIRQRKSGRSKDQQYLPRLLNLVGLKQTGAKYRGRLWAVFSRAGYNSSAPDRRCRSVRY
jgi:hypothetical protein